MMKSGTHGPLLTIKAQPQAPRTQNRVRVQAPDQSGALGLCLGGLGGSGLGG